MPDPAHDDDAVRRLLAEARHREPLPPDVADRLDTLLGRLVEARSAETGVPSLSRTRGARRYPRRGVLLLAAAAAVVAGIGVPTVNQLGSRGGDQSASTADAGASGASAATRGDDSSSGTLAAPEAASADVVLTSGGFDTEVRRLTQSRFVGRSGGAPACGAGDYGPGRLVDATYDGTPALLAYRPAEAGAQRVDLLVCGTAAVIRTTTVPVP